MSPCATASARSVADRRDVIHSSLRRHGESPAAGMLMAERVSVRVTYVTESFPPDVNGVAHTAVRVTEHLLSRGHEPLVIAPEPARGVPLPDHQYGFPIARVPSVGIPIYRGFRVGLPGSRV